MNLFERLVQESGLSRVFARSALERALARSNARPETLTMAELREALPHIESALRVFLPADEVGRRMAAIARLVG